MTWQPVHSPRTGRPPRARRHGQVAADETFDTADDQTSIHVSPPDRRDRLLLISALAIAALSLLGAVGKRIGYDRWLKANTVKRRTHSLFRQGLMLYHHLPNWPEDRIRPLMETFGNMLMDLPAEELRRREDRLAAIPGGEGASGGGAACGGRRAGGSWVFSAEVEHRFRTKWNVRFRGRERSCVDASENASPF